MHYISKWKVKIQTHNLSKPIPQKNSIVNVNFMHSSDIFQIYIITYFLLIHISLIFFSLAK